MGVAVEECMHACVCVCLLEVCGGHRWSLDLGSCGRTRHISFFTAAEWLFGAVRRAVAQTHTRSLKNKHAISTTERTEGQIS